jgi:hypothetical protein
MGLYPIKKVLKIKNLLNIKGNNYQNEKTTGENLPAIHQIKD